jgi:predicted ATPase
MKVTLKNIGLVESAEINIGGLTVITGHNSVGKSYIGKAIYSLVKADNENFKDENEELKLGLSLGRSLIKLLLINVTKTQEEDDNFLNIYSSWLDQNNFNQLYLEILKFIKELKVEFPNLTNDSEIKAIIKEIEETIYAPSNKSQISLLGHDFLIKSIFKGEYNNILSPNKAAIIRFSIKNQQLLETKVENNQTSSFVSNNFIPYKNITLIETPIILSLVSYIRDNLAFSEKRSSLLPQYIVDLVQKLVEGGYDTPTDNSLYNSIIKTISGQLTVDNNQVVYKDEAKNSYNINNVASGIKSFGIIQLLLAGGSINPNSILIIDEPEVHLHPEWQLEYAKLLVELVKNDIPVIVTSHSPYFVEALKVYSDKADISDKTYFYLGEMSEKGSTFKDVSQNLDLLFEKFSTPMLKLIIEK